MKKKDVILLSHLRCAARATLTTLSKRTGLPVSTIYDRMNKYSLKKVPKYTALLSFSDLGFSTTAHIMLKVPKEKKVELISHLAKSVFVNNLYKVNNGWDVLSECVFKDMCSLEEFVESLELKFGVINKQVNYVLGEIKREAFLADPDTAGYAFE